MNKTNNITIDLLRKMVSIPSFVDKKNNEIDLGIFIEQIVKSNFKNLAVRRQTIKDGRFNLVCLGSKPELLILAHLDTVQPQSYWKTNPLKLIVKDQKAFGLGTADMKGSIASFLSALRNTKNEIDLKRLAILFYIDEEYDFLGMKKFIEKLPNIKPKMVLSLDGDLTLTSGCRGLIELNIVLRGKSGHSSNPLNGVNAIDKSVFIFNELSKILSQYKDQYLGITTSNLAFLRGGTSNDNGLTLQREGNVIPDFVELTLEVRPSLRKVNSNLIISILKNIATKQNLKIENIKVRHSINPWIPSYVSNEAKTIQRIYKQAGVDFSKSKEKFSGYVDIQMLSEVLDVPMFVIGAGGENYHGPNEYVTLENLKKTQQIYEQVLKEYCRKDTNEN